MGEALDDEALALIRDRRLQLEPDREVGCIYDENGNDHCVRPADWDDEAWECELHGHDALGDPCACIRAVRWVTERPA